MLLLLRPPQGSGPHFGQSQVGFRAAQQRERAERRALDSRAAPKGAGFRALPWHGRVGGADGAGGSSTCPRPARRARGLLLLALRKRPALARDRAAFTRSQGAGADRVDIAELPVVVSGASWVSALQGEISPGPHLGQIDAAPSSAILQASSATRSACGSVHSLLAQMRRRAAEQRQVLSLIDGSSLALSLFLWQVELPMAPLSPQSLDLNAAAILEGMQPLDQESHRTAWHNMALMRLLGAVPRQLRTLSRKEGHMCSRNLRGEQILGHVQLYRLYGCDIDCLISGACKYPRTLQRSVEKARSVVRFLKDDIGLQDMCKLLRQDPALLSHRVSTLKTKIAHLEKIGVSVSRQLI